jgi:hypothetical protein
MSMTFDRSLQTALLAVLVGLFGVLPVRSFAAPVDDDSGEPPSVGQPTHVPFSKASGQFRIEVKAEPTRVTVEDPITLRVIVHARGAVYRAPGRIALDEIPAFTDLFYLKDLGGEGRQIDLGSWEFRYELRPRSVKVREVPSVPLAFYDPEVSFPERRFQIDYSEAIPLTVQPRRVYRAEPPPLPDRLYEVAEGSGLLETQSPTPRSMPWLVALVLLGPPLLCLGWYWVWQRLFPDAVVLARKRRSLAATLALRALKRGRRLSAKARTILAASTVARYFQERLDLPAAEPTPDEAAEHLRKRGLSTQLSERAAGFFRDCDVVRFAPAPSRMKDPFNEAMPLILAVEEATWAPDPS